MGPRHAARGNGGELEQLSHDNNEDRMKLQTKNTKKRDEADDGNSGIQLGLGSIRQASAMALQFEYTSRALSFAPFSSTDPAHGFALAEAWALLMLEEPGGAEDVEAHLVTITRWRDALDLYGKAFEQILLSTNPKHGRKRSKRASRQDALYLRWRREYLDRQLHELGIERTDVQGAAQ
jgi:hypothetical protein